MIYNKIKEIAKKRNVSIRKIEQECDISNGSICKWNEVDPGVSKLMAVANYFEIPIDYFILDDKTN